MTPVKKKHKPTRLTTVYENLILSLLVIVAVYLIINIINKRKEIVEFVFPSDASGGRMIAGWAGLLAVTIFLIRITSE